MAVLALPSNSEAQETLLCIADQATGFAWSGSKWSPTNFNVEGRRYIVRPRKNAQVTEDGIDYEIVPFGEGGIDFNSCRRAAGFLKHIEPYVFLLDCGGPGNGFTVNFRSQKFMRRVLAGYVLSKDTPYLEIGTCAEM